jgi:hypothetical protein
MAVINFPVPTYIGEPYTFNNKTWIWNGYAWDFNGLVAIVPSIGFESHIFSHGPIDPVDGDSYYFGDMPDHLPLANLAEEAKIICLYDGEVIDVTVLSHPGATGSNEQAAYYLVNETNATEVLILNNIDLSDTFNVKVKIDPAFPVNEGDKIYIRWETPVWSTNPLQVKSRVELKIRLTS